MNTVLAEELNDELRESEQTRYKIADDAKLREISRRLLEKNIRVYKALANV